MKFIIKLGLTILVISIFIGCSKQLPQKHIEDIKITKKIGILSSVQNTIYISGQGHKSISNWKINDYLENMIYDNMKEDYKNISIVPNSRNVILLNEEFELTSSLISDIIKENNLEVLVLINNTYRKKIYEPGLNFDKLCSVLTGKCKDRKLLYIHMTLYVPNKGEKPIKYILSEVYSYNIYDDEEELIWKNKEGNITKEDMKKLEKLYKDLLHKEIYRTLKEFKLINK